MEAIEAAVEKFRKLLTEQCERAEKMKNPPAQKRADGKIRIGLIDGDGIGPMITGMAQHALEVLLADKVKAGKVEFRVIDGLTIERRAELGCAIPPDVMEELKKFDLNDVVVDVEDKGALDFVIRSRLQCAICRGAEISYNWAEEDGHGKQ